MNELKVFQNPEFGEIRTVEINGEPWLVGKDVATALGYERAVKAIQDHVDQEDKDEVPIQDSIGRMQKTPIINESGVYSLVLSSKLPSAKKFKRWVTSDILPSVRKHGAYMTDEKLEEALLNPDVLIRLATDLKEEREKRRALETKVETDKPKVLFADSVTASDSSIAVGDLAKILKQNGISIGRNRLFDWLKGHGYLMESGKDNVPTQKAMELGLFEISEHCIGSSYKTFTRITPKVTGKGQQYFVNKFLSERMD